MKAAPIQESFSSGELSPLYYGRVGSEVYRAGLKTCFNYIPTLQGALVRRPGTKYVAEVKDSSETTRLIPFKFSLTDTYVLEFGDQYVRFFKNGVAVVDLDNSPNPLEVATPYLHTDLSKIRYVQSADVLYLVHPDYPPSKILRIEPGSFSANPYVFIFGVAGNINSFYVRETEGFQDGPYLESNLTDITLTPSAATGSVTLTTGPSFTVNNVTYGFGGVATLTTSATHNFVAGQRIFISGVGGATWVNGTKTVLDVTGGTTFRLVEIGTGAYTSPGTAYPALFESTDAPSGTAFTEDYKPGRLIRLREGTAWGWVVVTSYVNPHQVNAFVLQTLTNTNAKQNWALGLYSRTTGFPSVIAFHEDRIVLGANYIRPQRLDFSASGVYDSYQPSAVDGSIAADDAFSATLNSEEVNAIKWIKSDEKGLAVGTLADEWIIQAADRSSALSAVNATARVTSANGSAEVDAIKVGKAVLFAQTNGRKLRENIYFFDVDGFSAPDLSLIAEHITATGIQELVYQKEPQPVVWMRLASGRLVGMTYARETDAIRVGWHAHEIAGVSDAAGTAAVVESLAVVPNGAGTRYDVYMIVKRRINGNTKRYIEYLLGYFDNETTARGWVGVDSSITYQSTKTPTAITKAANGQVTVATHGYSNGDQVIFQNITGMTEINGQKATITVVDTNNFTIDIDTTNYSTFVSGGTVEKLVSTITGLSHLEGQTVAVWADGAQQESQVVSGGSITLDQPGGTVSVGLGYTSRAKLLRMEAGSADGTALGKTRRTHRLGLLLHRTYGVSIGTSFDNMTPLKLRNAAENNLSQAPNLFSGIASELLDAPYDTENEICIEQNNAYPGTILAALPQMVTYDR